jgi:hypothetical protein
VRNPVIHATLTRRSLIAAGAAFLGFALARPVDAAELVVVLRPPAMRYEPLPPPPAGPPRSWVWLPGHWVWNGRGYVWVPGYYVRRPPRYAGWVPGHWAPRHGGWIWVDGYWRR